MESLLNQELVAGLTGLQVLIGVAALLLAVTVLKKVFGGKEETAAHYVDGRCPCGWSGKVSKFSRICPKCTKPLPG